MNICLLTSTYIPLVGGLEIVVHNLAKALTQLGHKVYVVTPRPSNRPVNDNYAYKVIRFGFKGYGRLKLPNVLAVSTLIYVVKRYKIDAIHVHNVTKPGSWAFSYRKFNPKIPVIATPHGDDVQITPEIQDGVRLDPLMDAIVRRNLNASNCVTAISPSLRQDIQELVHDKKKIVDVPNGVWVDNYRQKIDVNHVRIKFGIPHDATAVISIGRNHPRKGFEYGIKTLALLKKAGHHVVYVLVGRDMEPIIQLARELGVSDCLITPGQVDPAAVADLLQASDIYLSTSIVESFGMTTLEAMGAGLPCVVTDIAGSRDLVSSEYGFLIKPGEVGQMVEKLNWLIENRDARWRMAEKARREALNFDWLNIASRYTDVYKRAISNGSSISS